MWELHLLHETAHNHPTWLHLLSICKAVGHMHSLKNNYPLELIFWDVVSKLWRHLSVCHCWDWKTVFLRTPCRQMHWFQQREGCQRDGCVWKRQGERMDERKEGSKQKMEGRGKRRHDDEPYLWHILLFPWRPRSQSNGPAEDRTTESR